MPSIVLYFLLFITRPCYHEPRNAAVAGPANPSRIADWDAGTQALLEHSMPRSALFVLFLAAFVGLDCRHGCGQEAIR